MPQNKKSGETPLDLMIALKLAYRFSALISMLSPSIDLVSSASSPDKDFTVYLIYSLPPK